MIKITNYKSQITNNKAGLTLIELMIVMAIIAVLAALIMGNLYILPRMRDTERKSELAQIQHAIEQYKIDSELYLSPYFPGGSCGPTVGSNCTQGLGDSTCGKIYLRSIPTDPNGTNYANCGNYYYEVDAVNNNIYRLAACLENKNDTGPDVQANTIAGFSCSTNKIFLLTNNP
ncbi:MAG: prepilin-type N-terminal cleavage/methylation domain-containing protein [Candidatus Levybacteria bacterium]|nr:prepilin-type N-terminal cleavage/methylation domain-containing protein [Candidatus Levybacteria bacterium]